MNLKTEIKWNAEEKPDMSQSLKCPNCSAPLDFQDKSHNRLRCPYCHTLLVRSEDSLVKPPMIVEVTGTSQNRILNSQEELKRKVEFIREMALFGNKTVAVSALCDVFNIEKSEAQELVEAMARGEAVDTNLLPPASQTTKTPPALDPLVMQKLLDLVRRGEKIEAIKKLRQETGVGLKDAKDVIEGMEETLSASPGVTRSYDPTHVHTSIDQNSKKDNN
jgi:ribosomal protein L7/L12/DNA-directed RNA polymerase subunit RPC12/RpoP